MSLNSSPTFINPEDKLAIPSWMEYIRIRNYKDATRMFDGKEWDIPFTNLDLFSLDGFSPEDIKNKFFEELWVKNTKNNEEKNTVKLNHIYHESISYMERVLYRKIPNGLKTKKWSSTNEFLEHLNSHLKRDKEWYYSLMFCAIIKVMLVEVGIYNNPIIDELDTDMSTLMSRFSSIPWIKVNEKWKKNEYKKYMLDELYSGKLENRPKSADSIRTKLIYNRPYNKLSKFKDLLAMRMELDPSRWERWYVHTIHRIRDSLYWKNEKINFEIKWGILSKSTIEEIRKLNITVIIKPSKWGASLNYEDAKFVWWRIDISKPGKEKKYILPEVQFVLPGNRNESWFSTHLVYDLKKIISANVRLFWALTIGNIQYILEHYKTEFDPRALLNHLLYPQEHWQEPFLQLIKTKSKRTGKERAYFSTSDIYNEGKNTISNIYNFPEPVNKEWAAIENIEKTVHDAIEVVIRNIKKNGDRPTP